MRSGGSLYIISKIFHQKLIPPLITSVDFSLHTLQFKVELKLPMKNNSQLLERSTITSQETSEWPTRPHLTCFVLALWRCFVFRTDGWTPFVNIMTTYRPGLGGSITTEYVEDFEQRISKCMREIKQVLKENSQISQQNIFQLWCVRPFFKHFLARETEIHCSYNL